MISELFVKNLALIGELRLEWGKGLNILSGETGAGKSLLVESVNLILGGKSTPEVIREGCEEASVEAVFSVDDKRFLEMLDEAGFEKTEEVIIRRIISKNGRSRAFLNGAQVTLPQLQEFGSYLIDLTGQHSQQKLLQTKYHGEVLDAAILFEDKNFGVLLENYESHLKKYHELHERVVALEKKILEKDQRLDFLTFQKNEIEKAKLVSDDEEEKLLDEKKRIKNGDFLAGLCQKADDLGSVAQKNLYQLITQSEKAIDQDAGLAQGLEMLKQAEVQLGEALSFFAHYSKKLSFDPGRLEEVESRLFLIQELKRKYGPEIADVRRFYEKIAAELGDLEGGDEKRESLKKEIALVEKECLKKAVEISSIRKKQARLFEKRVQKELTDLSLPKVQFEIEVKFPEKATLAEAKISGLDEVCFLFSANPGNPLRPLSAVASGGEVSRVMLALKVVLNEAKTITYLFDEIDTGISGAVASSVGRKLAILAKAHQVLCVTHLPQIASFATDHFQISKSVVKNKTETSVVKLSTQKDREEEVARLLSGSNVTESARVHAREMMKETKMK